VISEAALFLCGTSTSFTGHRFLDVSQPPTCPAGDALSVVTDSDIVAAQMAILDNPANPKRYLKMVGTAPDALVEVKTTEEKAAVDAALAAQEAERQEYEDAATNNDLCNATLDELATAKTALVTNLQGDIDGISNIATAKTELADMMGRLVNALEKLMRCIRGRAGPPQP
jgi:hypothetical protein